VGIVLINESTAISDAEVVQIAKACDEQLQSEVADAWEIRDPLRVTTTPDNSSYPFFFVDEIPEAPGALAYHFVQPSGVPAGKIGVKATLAANESLSGAASHEAVELQCDIFCASWSYSSSLRCLVATEACDPVQSRTYTVKASGGTLVEVSNFVTPYYFTENTPSVAASLRIASKGSESTCFSATASAEGHSVATANTSQSGSGTASRHTIIRFDGRVEVNPTTGGEWNYATTRSNAR
jgi:hypothetical protein